MNGGFIDPKGMRVYRFLGFFWLLMGINLLVLPHLYPDLREHPIMANNVPLAGFCFALAVYNTIRWRLIRSREIERERELEHELRRRDAGKPIDPTFDFSDPNWKDSDEKNPNA
jgi:hypothetical protein